MQIGTAAPTPSELSQAKHHFIHHKSIEDAYNVGAFEKEAMACLNRLFKTHNVVVMVGGSGLYVDAITNGLDDFPEIETTIRASLNTQLEKYGLESLQKQLQEVDPISYKNIAIDNPHRVIRALEISIGSGQPYSSFLNKNQTKRNFKTLTIGLTAERQIIYDRINKRVDIMIAEGLIEEVKLLVSKKNLNALNTVGYKEIFNYLNNEWPLDFAISEIKKNSRRFAKRQLTWFKKNKDTLWFDYNTTIEDVTKTLKAGLQ
jgi:tRNA dimethylallyltransferase